MEKKLEINIDKAFIKFKPFDASRLAIAATYQEKNLDVYGKFINFKFMVDSQNASIDVHYYEELSQLMIKKVPIVILEENVINFCIKVINSGMYVFLPVNTVKIEKYARVGMDFYPHHLLIFGFNEEKSIFYASDFFQFTYGQYTREEIAYTDLFNGFEDIKKYNKQYEDKKNGIGEWLRDIEILKPCPRLKTDYGIGNIICTQECYLDSYNSLGFKSVDEHYGYNIYKYLEEYTRCHKIDREVLDIHGYCVIRDRMAYILEQCARITCLTTPNSELEKVIRSYNDLKKQATIMLNLCIKFYFTCNNSLLDSIVVYLNDIKEKDYESTRQYISILRKIYNSL